MKDFTHLHAEQSEDNLSSQIAPPSQSITSNEKLVITIVFVLMLICTAINLMMPASAPYGYNDYVNQQLKPKDQTLNQTYIDEVEEYIQRRNTSLNRIPLSKKAKQRISYGQPRPRNSSIKAVVVQKKTITTKQPVCVVTNGVNVISNKTVATALNMLGDSQVLKWIVYLGLNDEVGEDLINKVQQQFKNMQITRRSQVNIDANYQFIIQDTVSCSSIVYLQNPFIIQKNKVKQLVMVGSKLKSQKSGGYVGYSSDMYNQQGTQLLQDLTKVNLEKFQQQKINKFIYVFDASLLKVITPINFVHYNKYTFQQMIIYPLLALTQKSQSLIPFKGSFHTFDQVGIQFKEFALKQVQSIRYSPCFVSFPSNPQQFKQQQAADYINAFSEIQFNSAASYTLVMNLPYNFQTKSKDHINIYTILSNLTSKIKNLRIRLRIQNGTTPSSQAFYQSAHTYCPKSSIMIVSRLNIEFSKTFINQLQKSISQKYHYYHTGKLNLKDDQKLSNVMAKNKNKQRFNSFKYSSDFSHVQIFKSDFAKMIHLWALKADENLYYETQASFTIPLLQMVDYEVMQLQTLYKISEPKKSSQRQSQQVKTLLKYGKWQKLAKNGLQPIHYNSLTNLDLRRDKMNQIPKIIHQIWLKEQKIPDSIKKKQSLIKEVNKGYKYFLWRRQNITFHDFPMSYSFIARTMEYQWAQGKDMHPWVQALLSYQVLHNFGGFYLSLNAQVKKSFDPFLKYQLFFAGFYSEYGTYSSPVSVGRQIIGARKNNYHLRFVLSQMITQQILDYTCEDYQMLVGGDILRAMLLDQQLFTTVGFGFGLVNYDPNRNNNGQLCRQDQIPCNKFNEAYVVFHSSA